MDGKSYYYISTEAGHAWGIGLPLWAELSAAEREAWEQMAHEQESADRGLTSMPEDGTLPA